MSSSALRWLVAATLTAALIAGLYFLAAGRFSVEPGRAVETVQRLVGGPPGRPERGGALVLSGTRRARARAEIGRSGSLGARLVESGRPCGPLSPLDAGGLHGSGKVFEPQATPPGQAKPPAPTRKQRAAARALSVTAARDAGGSNFAPRRRKIPSRAESDAKLRAALKAPNSVLRLGAPDGKMLELPAKPGAKPESGKPVAPPANDERPPAPVVPLDR